MLGLIAYMGATLLYLMALGLIDRSPRLSQSLFGISGSGYLAAGLLSLGSDGFRLLLSLSLLWHVTNCFSGWMRRYDREHLQLRLLRSWTALIALNGIFYITVLFTAQSQFTTLMRVTALVLSIVAVLQILYSLQAYRLSRSTKLLPDPLTVSLLIPARNEDHALSEALHVAMAIDYPRLEIIVLDDCSQDRTPEIVRGFAQDGIRFIRTTQLPEGWLGKNYAQARLAEEASGDFLVFADVDIRLSPHSITQLISYMQRKKLEMVSIAPERSHFDIMAHIFMPLVLWWQTGLPHQLLGRPIVSHSCYVITRTAYRHTGGHRAWPLHVMPELMIASQLEQTKSYGFIINDQRLGISTRKKLSSQEMTNIRLSYPLLGASPGLVLMLCVLAGLLVVWPMIDFLITGSMISVITWLLYMISLYILARRTHPQSPWLAFIQMPWLLVHEIIMLLISMWRYELGTVAWKERNICYPKLQVIPHLPKLK